MSTLFSRLGGNAATVDRFYDMVLADERIRHFLADTEIEGDDVLGG